MDNMGNGVQMTYDLNNGGMHHDGYGYGYGGGLIWLILAFLLISFINRGPAYGFGGGYGYGYGGATPGTNFINNDFMYSNLTNQIRGIESTLGQGFTQVANQNFGISKDMCQGFANVNQGIANLGYSMQNCCCETNRNIDSVRFDMSQGLCGVNRNIDASRYEAKSNTTDLSNMMQMLSMKNTAEMNAGFQKILDRMCADKEAALTARINQLELGAAINAGNTRVIDAVRPFPQPAYITCSPYEAVNLTGLASGCGCGFYSNR